MDRVEGKRGREGKRGGHTTVRRKGGSDQKRRMGRREKKGERELRKEGREGERKGGVCYHGGFETAIS